jgi:mono/diheme cytochrome c family protein
MHSPRFLTIGVTLLATTVVSGVAFGLPWDTDMANSESIKAYEAPMAPLPAGVVAQPNMLSPDIASMNYDRMTPEGQALQSPFDADLVLGEKMYSIYCSHCHGDGTTLGAVAYGPQNKTPHGLPAVHLFGTPPKMASLRSDGYIYLTIRNGGAIMPRHGYAMSDREMWAVVSYLRSQPGGAYALAPVQ